MFTRAGAFVLWIYAMTLLMAVGHVHAGEIGISTGPSNLAYYGVGKDIQRVCPDLSINIYESKGGVSNVANLFTSNQMQFGIVAYDTLLFKQLTNDKKMEKIVTVFPLYKNGIQVVASHRSGIKTISDMNGKRVNLGPVGSGSWVSANLVRMKTGQRWTESTYNTADSLRKVMNGELDAAFYFSGVPTPDLQALGKDGDGVIRLVNLKHPALDTFYTPSEIAENTYAWEHNATFIYTVQNLLVAYNYGSAEKQKAVADLASCINHNLPSLQEQGFAGWREVDPQTEVKWPWHPAARAVLGR